MKSLNPDWLHWFFVFSFSFSSLLNAAPVSPAPLSNMDERRVEQERDQAVGEALSAYVPLTDEEAALKGKAAGDEKSIALEVEKLRRARKSQFKHLTWTHIKQMITTDSVLARNQFLDERDKRLGVVLDRAVQVHVPAEVARERMGLAKFRIAKAIRDFFPEASFSTDSKVGALSAAAYQSRNWRFNLRQPLFRGGVLYNTLLLELANLETAKREYDKTISDLVADASQAYFEYERARNVQQDQTELFERAKEQKRISDEKYKANLISEIEKLNVDSLYSQAQYDLETAQQELEIARLDLQKFLDLEVKDPIEIQALYHLDQLKVEPLKAAKLFSGSSEPRAFESSLNQFIELAYEYRPDLRVEASKLKATQLAYRVAMGKRLPQADFIFEIGELAEAFRVITDHPDPHHEYRYGVEVTWPLGGNTAKFTYDNDERAPSVSQFQSAAGTRTIANSFSVSILDDMGQFATLKEAKISSLEQVVELEKTERDVLREVKEAFFNFNKALIQVESAYKRMGYRERLVQVSKHRLDQNEIQISEYLQAQMDHTEERGLVYKALADFFLSKAKLNRAIGVRDYLTVEALA